MRLLLSLFLALISSFLVSIILDWLVFTSTYSHFAGIPLFLVFNTITCLVVFRQTDRVRIAQVIMVCISCKLLISLGVIIGANFMAGTGFVPFSTHFIAQYIVFTIFETALLITHLNSKSVK
jgi:hypothetical protein